jgi:hypothetical protein
MRPRASAAAGAVLAGLLAWSAYLATGLAAAAWAGCVLLLPVAGLGMALMSLWLPERLLVGATAAAAQAAPAGPGAARHPPALIVAAHGVFAVATILFALLAAVGAR